MKQEDLKEIMKAIAQSGIHVAGDFVIEKHVENEVVNVETGGTGIQIINGKEEKPLTVSDIDIKKTIEELLRAKDEEGSFVFKNKKQWWAVFRVLSTFCNYPTKKTSFVTKMTDLKLDYDDNATIITYDSLSAAPKEVPQMACSPSAWEALKDISDNYKQQYVVAEFLMLKLGIKS